MRGVAREGQSDEEAARQGGGGAHAASTRPASSWQQLEEDKGRRWAGPTVLGHSWAARFAFSLSAFCFNFVFYYSVVFRALLKILRHFQKS